MLDTLCAFLIPDGPTVRRTHRFQPEAVQVRSPLVLGERDQPASAALVPLVLPHGLDAVLQGNGSDATAAYLILFEHFIIDPLMLNCTDAAAGRFLVKTESLSTDFCFYRRYLVPFIIFRRQ